MGKQLTALPGERLAAAEEFESVLLEAEGRPRPDFKIFTRGMEIIKTADDEEDGRQKIRCIASSSVKDLHGDVMTAACVRSMAKQAEGLTIFLNHQYRVPEDVFGVVDKSRTKRISAADAKAAGWLDKDSTSNEDVILLQLDISISKSGRSDETFSHIENGVTLGVSIGANILDYEEAEDADPNSWWPPLIINDVDLLEASIVGIPANPLSWIEGATKGLITKGALPGVTETVFRRAQKAAKVAADGWEDPKEDPKVSKKQTDPKVKADDEAEADPFKADGPEEIVAHYQMQVESGVVSKTDLDAMEEAIQASIDYALENGVEKSAFEGRTAADLAKEVLSAIPADEEGEETADEAETPEGDQEAPTDESDPESDDKGTEDGAADKAAEELKALTESGVLKGMTEMVSTLEDVLTKLFAERALREQLETEKAELVSKLAEASANVDAAVKLVKQLMELPLARKSAPIQREAQAGLEALKNGPYSEDVLRILYPHGEGEPE